jgi:hypothetical protein
MAETPAIDITSTAFALRLANLLKATRTERGDRMGRLARASQGRYSRLDLREYERGVRALDDISIDELTQLYRCDLGAILPQRLPVSIAANRISAGGVNLDFEPTGDDALLNAYLGLVRTLRRQKHTPVVDLRRDDLEVLADFLHQPRESVLHRLATLMNASQRKRTAMIGVLASGAAVIGLVGTAAAMDPADNGGGSGATTTEPPATVVTTVESTAAPTTDEATTSVVLTTLPEPTTTVVVATTSRSRVVPSTTSTAPTLPMLDTDIPSTTAGIDIDGPPLPLPLP